MCHENADKYVNTNSIYFLLLQFLQAILHFSFTKVQNKQSLYDN